jgi:hypothetical protein
MCLKRQYELEGNFAIAEVNQSAVSAGNGAGRPRAQATSMSTRGSTRSRNHTRATASMSSFCVARDVQLGIARQ